MTFSLYSRLHRLQDAATRLPLAAQIFLIYGLSRLWGMAVFGMTARQQAASPWAGAQPSYLEFLSFWDSGWYAQIAENGYPQELPLGDDGRVQQNPWAFYPLFPYTALGISKITGLGYYASASFLALISGFIAALVIYKLCLVSLSLTNWGSTQPAGEQKTLGLWSVAVLGFLPISAVLQAPYAESFNLIFLALTLLFLLQKRWLLLIPFALLACLSRPIGVPLGATAGLYWLGCAVQKYRENSAQNSAAGPLPAIFQTLKDTGLQLASALVVCGFALLWPLIAWIRTGQVDAYTATETAWRGTHLAPFMPWLSQAELYFGSWGILAVLILLVGLTTLFLAPTFYRALSPLLVLWCASYITYLLLFLNPQSSTFRLLLPLFPLVFALVAASTSRAYRLLLVVAGALGQLWWVSWLWHYKQFPYGGDYPP